MNEKTDTGRFLETEDNVEFLNISVELKVSS